MQQSNSQGVDLVELLTNEGPSLSVPDVKVPTLSVPDVPCALNTEHSQQNNSQGMELLQFLTGPDDKPSQEKDNWVALGDEVNNLPDPAM